MPAKRFTVELTDTDPPPVPAVAEKNPDVPAVAEKKPVPPAVAETRPVSPAPAGNRRERRKKAQHHGVPGDERLAARQRSELSHSKRAADVGQGRSYAFRRS